MGQLYEFHARSQSGKRIKGKMEASSAIHVMRNLQDNGFIPTDIEKINTEIQPFQRKVPLKELALFCQQLSTMLRTGIPIIQALQTIKKQIKNKRFREIIHLVNKDLTNGETVSGAFQQHKSYFPPLFINLLYAAETSGNLDEVLLTLAESFKKDIKIRTKLKSAITYPIFILIFATIMITALILYVLPTFVGMFENSGAELPILTRILLGMNQFLTQYGLFLILGLGVVIFLVIQWGKTTEGRYKIDTMISRLPIIGEMIKKNVTFRFSQTLLCLQSSGVLIEKSLQIISEVVNNSYYSKEIESARNQIINGSDIASALEKSEIFPDILISMVRIGEESGELENMLKDVAEYSQNELEQKLSELTSLIEPLLLIIVGLIVGLAIMGILLPMYDGMMNVGN